MSHKNESIHSNLFFDSNSGKQAKFENADNDSEKSGYEENKNGDSLQKQEHHSNFNEKSIDKMVQLINQNKRKCIFNIQKLGYISDKRKLDASLTIKNQKIKLWIMLALVVKRKTIMR